MSKKIRVFVLLSGGIDSTTTLAIAAKDFPDASFEAVSVNYGQRHVKELSRAREVVNFYKTFNNLDIEHKILDMPNVMTGMLVGESGDIPDVSYADLPEGISPTYVSFRNGLMLSLVAAKAQSWIMNQQQMYKHDFDRDDFGDGAPYRGCQNPEAYIYCGVHADDGANWAYPDCTPEFIGGMANAIFIGTYNTVRLRAPLQYMDKAGVIREGSRLGAPLSMTWSCYKGEDEHCGVCPTCRSRREAFIAAGITDLTEYLNHPDDLDSEDYPF